MVNKHQILIVEDELELAKSIMSFLSENGYIGFHAASLKSARLFLEKEKFTAVLLDLGLPDGNGMDLIKQIKNVKNEIGLIIISAKNILDKKIEGLELGADDYLTKPFFFPELNARLKSVIRRLDLSGKNEIVVNEICVFPDQMEVLINDRSLQLTTKEFDLLLYFISNQNRVISKITLGEYMSNNYNDIGFSDDMVYSHIKNLKKKLSASGCKDYIRNIYGVGYKFTV